MRMSQRRDIQSLNLSQNSHQGQGITHRQRKPRYCQGCDYGRWLACNQRDHRRQEQTATECRHHIPEPQQQPLQPGSKCQRLGDPRSESKVSSCKKDCTSTDKMQSFQSVCRSIEDDLPLAVLAVFDL